MGAMRRTTMPKNERRTIEAQILSGQGISASSESQFIKVCTQDGEARVLMIWPNQQDIANQTWQCRAMSLDCAPNRSRCPHPIPGCG
jgi:hypothetical protein